MEDATKFEAAKKTLPMQEVGPEVYQEEPCTSLHILYGISTPKP